MRDTPIRVALFADAYLEVDGVANTMRQYEAYARRNGLPFLLLHGGYEQEKIVRDGAFSRIELPRGRFRFALDRKHDFDLGFIRHLSRVEEAVQEFAPDVVHITGPSDVGIVGALAAHRLHIPLLASWHTNLHLYAERRALPLFAFLPSSWRERLGTHIREVSFRLTARFYQIPRVLMAPNRELIELLEIATGKPCFLMARGVDTELFQPRRRNRQDRPFTIGYVGRITIEKNVEMLVEIEQRLLAAGLSDYQFLIVGQGGSESFLRNQLKQAIFTGVLRGEELARAYANMDVFLFPSKTDTFGNVVLEALAAGTPALVTDQGGPQFIVRPGVTGFVCRNATDFVERILWFRNNPAELRASQKHARHQAEGAGWDSVFHAVYRAYEVALAPALASARAGLKMPLGAGLKS
ncbi:MAG TPA: glycosyltransferase [Terriglobales bacterium]|nr:glycosyltransferase [Terriglobales bacterium]